MGANDVGRRQCCPKTVPVVETGEVRPECSGDHSCSILEVASRWPIALAFDDPIAGAAFCPSPIPTWRRCIARFKGGFGVDRTESVGLPGLSDTSGKSSKVDPIGCEGLETDTEDERCGKEEGSETPEPFIAVSLRRRSSKGAPLGPYSTLDGRDRRDVSVRGDRGCSNRV